MKRRINNNVLEIYDESDTPIFTLEEKLDSDGVMNIILSGEIRNEVAHEFEDEVMAALLVCSEIRLNFEKVSYIASIVLKSLLSIQRLTDEIDKSKVILAHVSEEVMTIFRETGFVDILEIETE